MENACFMIYSFEVAKIEIPREAQKKSATVVFSSYSAFFLPCWRRSLAHFAQSSCAEVLVVSRSSLTISLHSCTPAAACLDCGVGSLV